jgi:hypothetical protein
MYGKTTFFYIHGDRPARLSENSNFLSDRGKLGKITGGIYLISESMLTSEDNFFEFNEDMGERAFSDSLLGSSLVTS